MLTSQTLRMMIGALKYHERHHYSKSSMATANAISNSSFSNYRFEIEDMMQATKEKSPWLFVIQTETEYYSLRKPYSNKLRQKMIFNTAPSSLQSLIILTEQKLFVKYIIGACFIRFLFYSQLQAAMIVSFEVTCNWTDICVDKGSTCQWQRFYLLIILKVC